MESYGPETLHNAELEWFLNQADADCGLQSSFGAQLEVMHRRQLKAVTKEDEDLRRFRIATVKRAQLTLDLRRDPSPNEVTIAVYYAEKFGVGVVDAPAKEEPNVESRQPYGDGHCTFRNNPAKRHDQTAFAKLRRCFKVWQQLEHTDRQVLAAYYMGMNPTAPAELRDLLRRTFGELAAVVYWASDEDAEACSMCTEQHRTATSVFARLAVCQAHKRWSELAA